MNKKDMTETDIRTKYITPAIVEVAGWDREKQLKEEYYFTDGRINVVKKKAIRDKGKKADYILFYKPNIPIAIIEAKDNKHSIGAGMQQALEYAEILDIPFVYSSNGDGFIEHDRTGNSDVIEKEIKMGEFPTPEQLWQRYKKVKNITEEKEKIITQNYYFDSFCFSPRYYQRIAINRTIEAVANGKDRILLVMATGTGKTYTAFQIIHRLWKSETKKRILFLADRNILVDQTMQQDFKPFADKMTKIKNKEVSKAYEIYLALYQSMTNNKNQDENGFKDLYKQFSRDFFDLIVIDECHRGSAKEDSAWREILEYFNSATQIGMTATPKEDKKVSNTEYFGEPVYTYSLKQGIEDGFLAPYKVIRVMLDTDVEGFRPFKGQIDKYGNEIEDREYNIKDYDRTLVLEDRTKIIAKKVSDYLKENDSRMAKTIFFCQDIEHAERMRMALINENKDLYNINNKYVMQITGDNDEGKKELDNFIAIDSQYPVLVTTSKLLTTGVDAKTCKYIVLDSNINSMIEFKQIIGRGTRINEEYNKLYFTIIDFRNVTRLFADKSFDGEPVVVKETEGKIPLEQSEEENVDIEKKVNNEIESYYEEEQSKPRKYYIQGLEISVLKERVLYYDKNGNLITEKLIDYTKKNILNQYATLDEFLQKWNSEKRKIAIIEELEQQGIVFEALSEEINNELDPFDLICHIAFDKPALTRYQRANNVKNNNYFSRYEEPIKQVLEKLLEKYVDEGIENLENMEILQTEEFREFGTVYEIVKNFGGKDEYVKIINNLEKELYKYVA